MGATDDGTQRRRLVHVAFVRCLACIWLVQALVQWIAMLTAQDAVLDRAWAGLGVATVLFAVLDPVAAVGLWLATAWGGIIWVLAVVAQLIAVFTVPGFSSPLWIGVDGLLVGLYLLLMWLEARSRRP